MVMEGTLSLTWIASTENYANIMTKHIRTYPLFIKHQDTILCNATVQW